MNLTTKECVTNMNLLLIEMLTLFSLLNQITIIKSLFFSIHRNLDGMQA